MTDQPERPRQAAAPAKQPRRPQKAAASAKQLVNPLVATDAAGRPQTTSSGPFAEVRVYRDRVRLVYWPTGKVTGGQPRRRPAAMKQLVDVGRHQSTFSVDLPARGGSAHFAAELTMTWWVTDPLRVLDLGLDDVVDAVRPELVGRLRRITADYPITEPVEADRRIAEWLDSASGRDLGTDHGLEVRVHARLRPSAEVETAINEGTVESIRTGHLQEKVAAFSGMIANGDVTQFAFAMAQNPEQIPAVMNEIWTRQTTSHAQTLDFMKELIKTGVVERWEITDEIQAMLRWMQNTTRVVIDPRHPVRAALPATPTPAPAPASSASASASASKRPRRDSDGYQSVDDDSDFDDDEDADDEEWNPPPRRVERRTRRTRPVNGVGSEPPDPEDSKPDENIRTAPDVTVTVTGVRSGPPAPEESDDALSMLADEEWIEEQPVPRPRSYRREPEAAGWSGQFDDWEEGSE